MANQYSQSQQNVYQQHNQQQQQWLAYQQQQTANAASMNNLMTEHQKQWQQHLAMTAQGQNEIQKIPEKKSSSDTNLNQQDYALWQKQYQNQMAEKNAGSETNLNQQDYALWQKQYQAQQNAYSAMNMQNYQALQQQTAHVMQQQAIMAQMQQQQIQSQRALFQQQAKTNINQNYFASTGHLGNNSSGYRRNQNPNFLSQNAIYDKKEMGKLEEDEEMDNEHELFVPPAPQSKQEIEKYVNWQAKRKGISEQKNIDAQIYKRQQMSAMATEQEKKNNLNFTSGKKNSYTEPLLSDIDIDYECLDENKKEKSGGCCSIL